MILHKQLPYFDSIEMFENGWQDMVGWQNILNAIRTEKRNFSLKPVEYSVISHGEAVERNKAMLIYSAYIGFH